VTDLDFACWLSAAIQLRAGYVGNRHKAAVSEHAVEGSPDLGRMPLEMDVSIHAVGRYGVR
jgi:hypothetical protein